jgi:hypothetical protein
MTDERQEVVMGNLRDAVIDAPRDWTQERLQGWVAGHHTVLEAQFGEVAGIRNMDVQPQ